MAGAVATSPVVRRSRFGRSPSPRSLPGRRRRKPPPSSLGRLTRATLCSRTRVMVSAHRGRGRLPVPMQLPPRGGHIVRPDGDRHAFPTAWPPCQRRRRSSTGTSRRMRAPSGPPPGCARPHGRRRSHGERGRCPSRCGAARAPLGAQAWSEFVVLAVSLSALLLSLPRGRSSLVSAPGVIASMPHVEMTLASWRRRSRPGGVDEDARTCRPGTCSRRPRGGEIRVERTHQRRSVLAATIWAVA